MKHTVTTVQYMYTTRYIYLVPVRVQCTCTMNTFTLYSEQFSTCTPDTFTLYDECQCTCTTDTLTLYSAQYSATAHRFVMCIDKLFTVSQVYCLYSCIMIPVNCTLYSVYILVYCTVYLIVYINILCTASVLLQVYCTLFSTVYSVQLKPVKVTFNCYASQHANFQL